MIVVASAIAVVCVSALAAAAVIKPLAAFISARAFSLKIYSATSSQVASSRGAKPEKTGANTCVQTVAVRISIYAYTSTSTSIFAFCRYKKRRKGNQKVASAKGGTRYSRSTVLSLTQ